MRKTLIIVFVFINSCQYPELVRDEIIYQNFFEDNSLENISGGVITNFNNTNVLGNYNNDGFTIHLNDIGDHEYIFLSFDLYIHGSWDGNTNGFKNDDRPDLWKIEFNANMDMYNDPSIGKFITTFSNSPCFSNYCLRQSYPEVYPFANNPKKGHYKTDLKSKCESNFFGGPSTLYKIEKTFKSSGNAINIRFYDELYQPNAIDKNGIPQHKCDESWSLDNLTIRAISYK